MITASTTDQSFVEDNLTGRSTNNNEEAAHVLNIVNYEKDKRIASLLSKVKIAEAFELERDEFDIPKIKRYHLFNHKNSFGTSQNWIGYVTSIGSSSFKANIEDLDIQNTTYEEVEFDIDDVEEEDRTLLSEGSVFYWSVGYEYRGGTKSKQSILRFKRLPTLNGADIDNALDLTNDLFDNLKWE
jgi:hypothetical protein